MKSARFLLALSALLVCSQLHAVERVFCEGSCSPDTMRIRIEAPGNGNEIRDLEVGDEFTATVIVDVESAIQGFSLGVAHNPDDLQALETTVTQTVKDLNPFFDSASLAIGRGETEIDPGQTELRFGFVAAAIFPILPAPGVTLPLGDGVELATCRYRVLRELSGDTPTLLELVNDLIPNPGAPRTAVNYTIMGVSTPPEMVEDGEVFGKGVVDGACDGLPDWWFMFGDDPTANPDVRGSDGFDIYMRNVQDSLGFSMGIAIRGNDWTFEDDVVGNANDTIQLLITDSDGIDHAPLTNSATGPSPEEASVESVERGSAIAGFTPGDFLGVDLNPTVGGPGMTIGYVSDTSGTANVIPATGGEEPCFNNILRVNFTGVVDCPMWAFAFGSDAQAGNLDLTGVTSFPISMRNQADALGFSMGVSTAGGNYSFEDDQVGNDNTTIQLLIPDTDGIEHVAAAANTASNAPGDITSIDAGADIAGFTGDFLAIDLAPTVGGPGFTAGYVSDVDGSGDTIPATATTQDCPTNEILVVNYGDGPEEDAFDRGDCNGDGRLNVTDGAICAQNIFFNRIVFFDCDEMLDANNDDQLDMSDPVMILTWVFLTGADLPAPFQTCGTDPGDSLGCTTGQTRCDP